MSRRNGHDNGHGPNGNSLQWKMGLLNHQNKYLTAETFGNKINASGTTLRKKQMWTLEHDATDDNVVYLRSHLGRYLSADRKGKVRCEVDVKGDDEKFSIVYESAFVTGSHGPRWAFRSLPHGLYFGGSEDNLLCNEKSPGGTEWWTIHLAVHPQVDMQNLNRRKYAALDSELNQICVREIIPWGSEALITIEFRGGRYAVRASDKRYLHREGHLVESCNEDTLYRLEIRSGATPGIALRDCTERYLTAVGKDGTMQASKKSVGKGELFSLETSDPQVFFTAHNGRRVSIKQGVDLSANQDEVGDKEIFQMELDRPSKKWRFRTSDNKYWALGPASGIQAIGDSGSGTGLFEVEWLEDGRAHVCASNGRYVTAKLNGSLYAVSDSTGDRETFVIGIVNRPILVLRCDFGFIGFKSTTSTRVECNKSTHDVIYMEITDGPAYYLRGANNKYWSLGADGTVNADSNEAQPYLIEMRTYEIGSSVHSRLVIRAPNGKYIKGENNGIMSATVGLDRATYWEY